MSILNGNRHMNKAEAKAFAAKAANDEAIRKQGMTNQATLDALAAQRKIDAEKREQSAENWKRRRKNLAGLGHATMVGVPILSPMAVAWTGQAQFATEVLEWPLAGGITYAAAYELSGVFCAWMNHQARSDNDKGWEYRVATWAFAIGSALQQWWHYSDEWAATPLSVTYATMTIVGLIIWELYSRLMHRRELRKQGKIAKTRPRLGFLRWVRYPRISWHAWSATLLHNVDTVDEAWELGVQRKAEVEANKADRKSGKGKRSKKGKYEVQLLPAPKAEVPGPRSDQKELETSKVPTPEVEVQTPEVEVGTPTPDPKPEVQPERPKVQTANGEGSEDKTDLDEFEPSDLEKHAVEKMNKAEIKLNRTNVAAYIRGEMKGAIATTRAAQVAAWGRSKAQAA